LLALNSVTNVFYFVEHLDRARSWYERLLGTNPIEVQPQLVTFEIGSVRLTLHVGDEFNTPAELRGTVAYWGVDDVDEAVAQAVALGAVAHRGPKTIFTGERLCQLQDPFGNLLGVRQAPRSDRGAVPAAKASGLGSPGASR
jgi:predicted enzyme related to lactoylglutathione lyase